MSSETTNSPTPVAMMDSVSMVVRTGIPVIAKAVIRTTKAVINPGRTATTVVIRTTATTRTTKTTRAVRAAVIAPGVLVVGKAVSKRSRGTVAGVVDSRSVPKTPI